MDFSWSDEQREMFQAVSTFARKELNDGLIERDRDAVFNHEGWKQCGAVGLPGLTVPAEYGGAGADALTAVGVLEKFGHACRDNGLTFSLNAHLWTACMPLVEFGTDTQKQKFLPGLSRGDLIGGNAMSEPGSGSDAFSLRTTAEKRDGRYVLNGGKTWVTNAPVADVLVVYATIDPDKGAGGVTAFLVEKGTPDFTVGGKLDKMGLRTSPMAEVFFDNCEIPEENLLGKEGSGSQLFTRSMTWERSCILASAVGSMQRLLETCVKHARERKQFGQAIGKFQQVSSKIVDMKLRLETARHLLYHTAWLRGQGKSSVMEAALVKLHLSESWVKTCEDAIQIHGGYGYMKEAELERELRDAVGSRIYSGTSEIQRNLVAALLGL
jgi:alkylation response protein AidB-like acyl-CoA dehydrogenase